MTALARFETPNHHTPVVCPLNGEAMCTCGDELAAHSPVDYGGWLPADHHDPDARVCPEPESSEDGLSLVARHFVPATDYDDVFCTLVTDCTVCDVSMCSDHSDGFTTCSAGLHHNDCAAACDECRGQGGDV